MSGIVLVNEALGDELNTMSRTNNTQNSRKSGYKCTPCRVWRKRCTWDGRTPIPGSQVEGECDNCQKSTKKDPECKGPMVHSEDDEFRRITAEKAAKAAEAKKRRLLGAPAPPGLRQETPSTCVQLYQIAPEFLISSTLERVREEHQLDVSHIDPRLVSRDPGNNGNPIADEAELPSLAAQKPSCLSPLTEADFLLYLQSPSPQNSIANVASGPAYDFLDTASDEIITETPLKTTNIWESFLEQIPKRKLQTSREIFSWCIAGHRSFNRMELYEVLKLKQTPLISPLVDELMIEDAELKFKEASANFLKIDRDDNIHFINEDARNHLISGKSEYKIPLEKAHGFVAITILGYMRTGNVQRDCLLSSSPFRQRISRYMVLNLHLHCQAAQGGPLGDKVIEFFREFTNDRAAFARWHSEFGLATVAPLLERCGMQPYVNGEPCDTDIFENTSSVDQFGDQSMLDFDFLNSQPEDWENQPQD